MTNRWRIDEGHFGDEPVLLVRTETTVACTCTERSYAVLIMKLLNGESTILQSGADGAGAVKKHTWAEHLNDVWQTMDPASWGDRDLDFMRMIAYERWLNDRDLMSVEEGISDEVKAEEPWRWTRPDFAGQSFPS